MSMQFDTEQKAAIETVGTNILVSASAGAGKTGVLVARLMKRIVRDRIPLTRILAVTFTKAAAEEMKKRLAAGLHQSYEEAGDEDTRSWLSAQIISLENASITTIDSYCLTIISKYYSMIGLDPACTQNILEEGIQQNMQNHAFHEAIQELYQKDPERITSLCRTFSARSEDYDSIQTITEKISSAASSSSDPEEWYRHASESYSPVSRMEDYPEDVLHSFFDSLTLSINRILQSLDDLKKLAEKSEKADPENIQQQINLLMPCIQDLQNRDYDGFCLRYKAAILHGTPADSKYPEYSKARDRVTKQVKTLLAQLYPSSVLINDSGSLNELCVTLISLARLSSEIYQKDKKKNACMDFTDMGRYAYEILNRYPQAADSIRSSLDEILMDEFQDTSELQNAIIEKISRGDNVFRVGDVKQSIYRFRQARPQLMRSLMNKPEETVIHLRHNYRSGESIVRFSNLLFSSLMNVPGCRDTYTEEDTVTIGSDSQKEETPVPVRCILLKTQEPESPEDDTSDTDEDTEDPSDTESMEASAQKAQWISSEILRLHNENPELTFRHFAVLVRSHAQKPALRRTFDLCGIPYDMDTREGFYQSDLCQTVLSLCRCMQNPKDSISLLSLLTSSLYSQNDEQLAAMKQNGSFLQGVHQKFPQVFTDLDHLRSTAVQQGVGKMLNELGRLNHFYESLPDSQKANFDYLFEKSSGMSGCTLSEFISILETSEDEKSSEAMSVGSEDDLVTVTTIHQSKGLQYPVVFLWGTGRNYDLDNRSPVLVNDSGLIGMNHLTLPWRAERRTVQRTAAEYQENMDDLEEYTRLLYVALTRAEKRLYLVDTIKDRPIEKSPAVTLNTLAARRGMSGLILSALDSNDLFRIEILPPVLSDKMKVTARKYSSSLPSLSVQPPLLFASLTPSSAEVTSLPDLNFTQTGGTAYGTRMHEIIAALPDTVWSEQDLRPYSLSDNDTEKLLNFCHSDLYQQCLGSEIHKEYPFYVLDDVHHVTLTGSMDFVSFQKNQTILIDFKTDAADDSEIIRRYHDQLNTYRQALKIIRPDDDIQVYAWSLYASQAIKMPENE